MKPILWMLPLLAACGAAPNHLGNPLAWPVTGAMSAIENTVYAQRRGQVELFVKTNHPTLIYEIAQGGGPSLTQAMDLARIPASDRQGRILQMQGDRDLYAQNPGALIVSLMVYGDA